jgi:hypothetical protein
VDEIDNSVIASTTVPINSDITEWLDSLDIPVHKGHVFDYFDITAGETDKVTDDATVYIRYSVEGKNVIKSYINGDGDILLDCVHSGWTYTGSADVVITFSKNFDTVQFIKHDIYDFSATGEEVGMKPSTIEGNTISFTDNVIDTHNYYRVGLFASEGERVGKAAWDSGFKPVSVSVTQNGKTDTYEVITDAE